MFSKTRTAAREILAAPAQLQEYGRTAATLLTFTLITAVLTLVLTILQGVSRGR